MPFPAQSRPLPEDFIAIKVECQAVGMLSSILVEIHPE